MLHAVAQLVETALQTEWSGVRFATGPMGVFIDLILPVLGSTQPLTEMSTREISWG
jgi:hypothetical protein